MAPALLGLIKPAIESTKVLITKSGEIIQNNQNAIKAIDEKKCDLARECISSYKKEIEIVEKLLGGNDLSDEQIQSYLDRISEVNGKIEEFVSEWSKQADKEIASKEIDNKVIILTAIGILTGGIGLIPFGVVENKKK